MSDIPIRKANPTSTYSLASAYEEKCSVTQDELSRLMETIRTLAKSIDRGDTGLSLSDQGLYGLLGTERNYTFIINTINDYAGTAWGSLATYVLPFIPSAILGSDTKRLAAQGAEAVQAKYRPLHGRLNHPKRDAYLLECFDKRERDSMRSLFPTISKECTSLWNLGSLRTAAKAYFNTPTSTAYRFPKEVIGTEAFNRGDAAIEEQANIWKVKQAVKSGRIKVSKEAKSFLDTYEADREEWMTNIRKAADKNCTPTTMYSFLSETEGRTVLDADEKREANKEAEEERKRFAKKHST